MSLARISHHRMPFSRRSEGRGFSPAEIAGSQPLLISRPAQLFPTHCAGRETKKQLRASCNGGAKAPPFLVRGEKPGLVKKPTMRKLAVVQRNARLSRGLRGQQSLNTETAERSVPSVLKVLRHREHGENGRFQLSPGCAPDEPAHEDETPGASDGSFRKYRGSPRCSRNKGG